MVSYHSTKFGGTRPCSVGDITSLICHVTSQNHVIKGSCDLMCGDSSFYITFLPSLAVISLLVVEI